MEVKPLYLWLFPLFLMFSLIFMNIETRLFACRTAGQKECVLSKSNQRQLAIEI